MYNSYSNSTKLQGFNKYYFKSVERIRGKKACLLDVTFQSDGETLSSKNLDFRMENIVYIELLRRYKKDNVDVYFHKDGYEVDFVVVEKTSVLEF